jgi:DNA-binding GntR family transcriptional regulator
LESQTRSRKGATRDRSPPARNATTTVARIADEIRRGIKEGRYAPGQRLIESDLTRTLGVSRGPLREAMSRLAGDGLLVIEPNRGATVRALTRDEVRSISTIREALEGLAARLAAAHISEGTNLAEFKRTWADFASTKGRASAHEYVFANEHFHTLIVRLSGNAPLAQLLDQLRTPVYRFQFQSRLTADAIGRGHEDHRDVANAIIAGDPDRAERAMRRHLRNSAKLIEALPDEAFG